ncbi:MAG: SGNH/GDSL hydrolase family protein [Verrucomicrobia bacterium]|nr:SGNH/GDSL hydrolase family protein [Verrucomicrobiota bacterium]
MKHCLTRLVTLALFFISTGGLHAEQPTKLRDPNIPLVTKQYSFPPELLASLRKASPTTASAKLREVFEALGIPFPEGALAQVLPGGALIVRNTKENMELVDALIEANSGKKGGKPAPPPEFAAITDDPKLPRVLLMGDSVSIAYSPIVRRDLTGLANVHRVPANCGATKTALSDYGLTRWLKEGEKWDIIVFNHGLHDASYRFADGNDKDKDGNYASPARGCKPYVSLEDYERNLHTIIAILRKTGAKLLFATTTPIPDSLAEKYVENSEQPYNEVAKKVMKEESIPLIDLWSTVKPDQQKLQGPRNVHFRDEGSEVLGRKVAESIQSALPKAAP